MMSSNNKMNLFLPVAKRSFRCSHCGFASSTSWALLPCCSKMKKIEMIDHINGYITDNNNRNKVHICAKDSKCKDWSDFQNTQSGAVTSMFKTQEMIFFVFVWKDRKRRQCCRYSHYSGCSIKNYALHWGQCTYYYYVYHFILAHSSLFSDIYLFYWAHHDSNPTTYTSLAPQIT